MIYFNFEKKSPLLALTSFKTAYRAKGRSASGGKFPRKTAGESSKAGRIVILKPIG